MISPISIGAASTVVVPVNKSRVSLRFQNVGITNLRIKKVPMSGAFSLVSLTDFEVFLSPSAGILESGEQFTTNSISSFMVISDIPGGALAMYETNKI